MTDSSHQVAASQLDRKTRFKSILGGSAGNLVEWYVYAVFTLYFASQLFPEGDDTVKLLQLMPLPIHCLAVLQNWLLSALKMQIMKTTTSSTLPS